MQTLLTLGLGFGAIAGMAHAYGLLQSRRRRHASASAGHLFVSAGYVVLWTIGLWMLFGTYVLSLWLLATVMYAGAHARRLFRPSGP